MQTLTRTQARRLALDAQGLRRTGSFGSGREGALAAVHGLGYVQLDTIAVVERAHHHVLWSRVPRYRPALLDELLAAGELFEYWSHAAAFLPMRDFRFSLPRKRAFASGASHWFPRDERVRRKVLARVTAEGPLTARDFAAADGGRSGPWWGWKPAKIALEQLFMEGRLMVAERRNFQKVYDLTERVLPPAVDQTPPTEDEHLRHLVLSTLRSHGLATAPETVYGRRRAPRAARLLTDLADEGLVVPVAVEGLTERYWALPAALEGVASLGAGRSCRILSPFDNAVIQRDRLAALFDFDYRIECYTPEAKRQWGYFSLPILWGDRLAGRCDAKAERKDARLRVHVVHLEPGPSPARPSAAGLDAIVPPLALELRRFASFNGCTEVVVDRVEPRRLLRPLAAAVTG